LFLDLARAKTFCYEVSATLFPKLLKIVAWLEKVLGYKGNSKKAGGVQIEKVDTLFAHYIDEIETKQNRKGCYLIKSQ
jgi:hypothetical protein